MGGRGTFAIGVDKPFTYETVDKFEGIKILEKINKSDSRNLPERSHSSDKYMQLNPDGSFSKYREYGKDHNVTFEIEYGTHRGKKFLHYHMYVDGVRQQAEDIKSRPDLIAKYKHLFGGKKS